MNLTKITDTEILQRLERLTRSERKLTHLILWHILEVDERKLYMKLNYDSLYKYLTQHLGYSESAAYDRLQAARVLKQVPEVSLKIENGSLKLTQLVKVEQSLKQEKRLGHVVDPKTTAELIHKLENKNTYDTEKIIACELNQAPRAHQKIRPQQDNSVRLEVTLSAEQHALLKHAQSLMSHVVVDNNLAEVISYLAQTFIQKKERNPQSLPKDKGGARKENSVKLDSTKTPTQSFRAIPKPQRKTIAASVRRLVFAKAQNTCEHVNPLTKQKCGSKYQLQIDHIRPLAKGGSDAPENLRVLCGVHNRHEALRWGLFYHARIGRQIVS